LHPKIIARPGI